MGRTESSARPPPQSTRRAARAKEARRTINKVIPSLLAANYRARKGIREVELITNAYAWNPVESLAGGNHKKKSSSSNTAAASIAVVVAANGREKKAGPQNTGKKNGRTGIPGRNKKGTRKKKADDSSDDEEALQEIRAAKQAKEVARSGTLSNNNVDDNMTLHLNPSAGTRDEPRVQIRLYITDTITAASMLQESIRSTNKEAKKTLAPGDETIRDIPPIPDTKANEVSVLNMASQLRPGGGFLTGATSQEEHLCMRTTLLPSLHEHFYRLPDFGVVHSPDVLVFRPGDRDRLKAGGHDLLRRRERFFVDVVTAAMLRYPDIGGDDDSATERSIFDVMGKRYTDPKDRDTVEKKMQGVLAVMSGKGAKGAVLGAWGCGAYGNPVGEIAQAWKKTIASFHDRSSKDLSETSEATSPTLHHIIFAIKDEKTAHEFALSWGENLIAEYPPHISHDVDAKIEIDEELERLIQERYEAEEKIQELEDQLTQTKFPDRLEVVLQGLRRQLETTVAAIQARHIEANPTPFDDVANSELDDDDTTTSNDITSESEISE